MKLPLSFSLLTVALPLFLAEPAAAADAPQPAPAAEAPAEQPPPFDFVYLTDPRGFLVYAWRNADSAPLDGAELRLLDLGRNVLHTCLLKDGLVQGELPPGARYLQLHCEGEDLITEVRDSISRPDPHAPKPSTNWTQGCAFSDRRTYRPGDTVRLVGIRRDSREGVLHYPENTRQIIEYKLPGEEGLVQHRQEVSLAADGTWFAELQLPQDMKGMTRVELYEPSGNFGGRALFQRIEVAVAPTPSIRVDGVFSVQNGQVESSIHVTSADGRPQAGRQLNWELLGVPGFVMPEGFDDYFFGDGRPTWSVYNRQIKRGFSLRRGVELDEDGRSLVRFTIPQADIPQRMELILNAHIGSRSAPDAIIHREKVRLEPAELCVGLRRRSAYTKPWEEFSIDLVLVSTASGLRYEGDPVELEVVALRHEFEPGQFADLLRKVGSGSEEYREKITLPAEGTSHMLRLEKEGAYDILVQGRDAEGNRFASVVRQYVWGGERAPWLRDVSGRVELTTRMGYYGSCYRVGEMLRLLYPVMMEGTAIIVIEGDERRHVLRQQVLPGQRAICFRMLEEYGTAPAVTLAVVQGAGPRPMHGRPMVQVGEFPISRKNEPTSSSLNVQLSEGPFRMQPGEQWAVEGRVCDAQGMPVPGATVLIGARDVGATEVFHIGHPAAFIMQEAGLGSINRLFIDAGDVPTLPDLRGRFAQWRSERFRSSFNRPSDEEQPPRWWNGYDLDAFGENISAVPGARARRGNAPVLATTVKGEEIPALWERVITDEQGYFRTLFTAPNERTEIQLFALACGQPEQFGVAGVLIPIRPAEEAAAPECPPEVE